MKESLTRNDGLTRSQTAPAATRDHGVYEDANKLTADGLDGFSVNTGEFWKVWAEAGGNVESYMKDALPTYGLIGALALSKQLSMTTDPPSAMDDTTKLIYGMLTHGASLMSFSLILVCMTVKTQYNCCIDEKTRVAFACKFGWVVPLLFTMLIVMGGCWFAAILMEIYQEYTRLAFTIICIESGVVGLIFFVICPIWIQKWNANENYGPQIPKNIKMKMNERFDSLDVNGDGVVTREEFLAASPAGTAGSTNAASLGRRKGGGAILSDL